MEFAWDESKRLAVLRKHAIDFVGARTIWDGPVIDPFGQRDADGEIRVMALDCMAGDEIIVAVIYTDRGNIRRLISARRARMHERAHYTNGTGRGR